MPPGTTVFVPVLALAGLALAACGGGATGPGGDALEPTRILAIGVARQDASPDQPAEGYLAFFYDLDADSLLRAEAAINGTTLSSPFAPVIIDGLLYFQGAEVTSGTSYRLAARVETPEGPVDVQSAAEVVPSLFGIDVPARHTSGQPLTVRWTATPDAEKVNVSAGSGFAIDVPASQTSVTIPAEAFAGIEAGETLEIEVTAYNTFYAPVFAGINSLANAETLAGQLAVVDNIEGALGAFGAATTVGALVTIE
ncbi:hypothetical protein BH18GEM1_BH18GEM1_20210 [soil metagenome]